MNKRKKYKPEFKTKVVLEALQERQTLSELASKYGVHPNQINNWKRQFLDNADSIFEKPSTNSKKKSQEGAEQEKLYKKIGQLQVEIDFLRDVLGKV